MALTRNGTPVENVTLNGNVLESVKRLGVVVWETWQAWSEIIQNPAGFSYCVGFPIEQYAEFENDDTHKVVTVTSTAHVYCHGNLNEGDVSATVWATIEASNDKTSWVEIAKSESASASRTKGSTASKSISYTWDDGCPYKYIRVYTKGTSFKRYVVGTLTGFQKG